MARSPALPVVPDGLHERLGIGENACFGHALVTAHAGTYVVFFECETQVLVGEALLRTDKKLSA